jgi:hypothetical protein
MAELGPTSKVQSVDSLQQEASLSVARLEIAAAAVMRRGYLTHTDSRRHTFSGLQIDLEDFGDSPICLYR